MRVMNPLNFRQTALERAFEIARSGECETVEDIRRQLIRERHNQFQLAGPCLTRQLLDVMRGALSTACIAAASKGGRDEMAPEMRAAAIEKPEAA